MILPTRPFAVPNPYATHSHKQPNPIRAERRPTPKPTRPTLEQIRRSDSNGLAALHRRQTLATPEPTRPTPVQRHKMSPEQQQEFKDAIHICPMWSQANRKSFDYLNDALTEPIAIVRAKLTTNKSSGKNCCSDGSVLPVATAICVGAIVILLQNQLVEDNLINGSIGIVREICYAPGETMGDPGAK
ncbi:hypothetical protein THAOC_12444, partial [Thalassiosira oceanica]